MKQAVAVSERDRDAVSLEPVGEGLCKPGLNYKVHVHKVRAVVPEELLDGPQALGISFEFWENLVLRYLKRPNHHDLILAKAVRSHAGGLPLDEFTQREILYLSLTSVLKREEIRFFDECQRGYFETYSERDWEYDQSYPHLRFSRPIYKLANDRIEFFQFDDPQACVETSAPIGESDCVYHEPKRFRRFHEDAETLTLDCCRGITSRRLAVHVDTSHHLAWIAEYANACELCQEEADEVIRDFAAWGLSNHHRPRFHPAYFPYGGLQKEVPRDIRYIYFYSNLKARLEEGSLQLAEGRVYEHRPTKAVIFSFLIEAHILELKAVLEAGHAKNIVVPLDPSKQQFFESASTSGVSLVEVSIGFLDDTAPKVAKTPVPAKIYKRKKIKFVKNRVNPAFAPRRSPRLRLGRG